MSVCHISSEEEIPEYAKIRQRNVMEIKDKMKELALIGMFTQEKTVAKKKPSRADVSPEKLKLTRSDDLTRMSSSKKMIFTNEL